MEFQGVFFIALKKNENSFKIPCIPSRYIYSLQFKDTLLIFSHILLIKFFIARGPNGYIQLSKKENPTVGYAFLIKLFIVSCPDFLQAVYLHVRP